MNGSDTTALPKAPEGLAGFMFSFHKYGLPGVVIAVLFAFNGGLTFYLIKIMGQSTQAMTEMSKAAEALTDAVERCKGENR
jgi:hypothetical protein